MTTSSIGRGLLCALAIPVLGQSNARPGAAAPALVLLDGEYLDLRAGVARPR